MHLQGNLQKLFQGRCQVSIECTNIRFERKDTIETFDDIQLDVEGCENIYESFDKYVQSEPLDGDRRFYTGEEFGLQCCGSFRWV